MLIFLKEKKFEAADGPLGGVASLERKCWRRGDRDWWRWSFFCSAVILVLMQNFPLVNWRKMHNLKVVGLVLFSEDLLSEDFSLGDSLSDGSKKLLSSVQFSCSVSQSHLTFCDPMGCSMPGLPVHHQLLEFADAIQPAHPLSSPSPPTFSLTQHQGLFQWVSSSHQVAKVLELQLQQTAPKR